ncbi:MAG: ATP-binding protein, partial [Thermodesulfobacteriota bacterium]
MALYYLKNKDGKEIDFLVTHDKKPRTMIEVKWSTETLSPAFPIFTKHYPNTRRIQMVKELRREKTFPDGAEIRSAHHWLSRMDI